MNIKNIDESTIVNELVQIGLSQSEVLGANCVEEKELRKTVDKIIVEREYLKCLEADLITKEEFANVLLAHFQSSICHVSDIAEPKIVPDYSELSLRIITLVSENETK